MPQPASEPPGEFHHSPPKLVDCSSIACAACTAPVALTIPAPQIAVVHVEPVGNAFALDTRTARTWLALKPGATASISETTPDTIGAAKLVPSPMSRLSFVG